RRLLALSSHIFDTTPSYTFPPSLHAALPIVHHPVPRHRRPRQPDADLLPARLHRRLHHRLATHHQRPARQPPPPLQLRRTNQTPDRKSTRLNSSHVKISYAVFCLKKKSTQQG